MDAKGGKMARAFWRLGVIFGLAAAVACSGDLRDPVGLVAFDTTGGFTGGGGGGGGNGGAAVLVGSWSATFITRLVNDVQTQVTTWSFRASGSCTRTVAVTSVLEGRTFTTSLPCTWRTNNTDISIIFGGNVGAVTFRVVPRGLLSRSPDPGRSSLRPDRLNPLARLTSWSSVPAPRGALPRGDWPGPASRSSSPIVPDSPATNPVPNTWDPVPWPSWNGSASWTALWARGARPLEGTRVVAAHGASLTGLFAETGAEAPHTGISLARTELDAALVDHARNAGVTVLEEHTAVDLVKREAAVLASPIPQRDRRGARDSGAGHDRRRRTALDRSAENRRAGVRRAPSGRLRHPRGRGHWGWAGQRRCW